MKLTLRILPVLLLLAFALEGKFPLIDKLPKKHPQRIVDPAKSAKLVSRIPCDGASSPEDHPVVRTSFSSGGWDRLFTVNVFEKDSCPVDIHVKCLHKEKEGWRDAWMVSNKSASQTDQLSLRACYDWGTAEPAQYVLSGWYQQPPTDPKKPLPWQQAEVKKVGSNPDVYEFTDPQGGASRLELTPR